MCTKEKMRYFGKITNGQMNLSDMGKIAEQCWLDIKKHSNGIRLDEFIIMPDRIHGIIQIVRIGNVNDNNSVGNDNIIGNDGRCAACGASTKSNGDTVAVDAAHALHQQRGSSLGTIVNSYKSAVTNRCHKNGYKFGWQRNYFDRIIRNDSELDRIRQYIADNPKNSK
ncbi:MAG: transposase [Candidatus Margulisiibacteriota bacterium]